MPVSATVEDAYPLTMLQAGMLFHSELDETSSTYHDLLCIKLRGPFAPELFQQVIGALVARHEVLRSAVDLTTFSEPMQLVYSAVEVPFVVHDLRGLPEDEQFAQTMSWRAAEIARPFDLSTPPLLRVHSQRLTDTSFYLNISFHHVVLDGWSLSLLTSCLLREYDRMLTGHQPSVPALRGHYRDHVALERRVLADEAARAYWRDVMALAPAASLPRWYDLELLGRSTVQRYQVRMRGDRTPHLREVAAKARTATKAVLFAAHASVLSRLLGSDLVVTGLVGNCRPETVDGDQMLGVFLNTLPLVVTTKAMSWLELIGQVHRAEVEAIPFRRYPLAQMIRDSGRDVPFETLVDYRRMRSYAELSLNHIAVDTAEFSEKTNFPLMVTFQADPVGGDVELRIDYDAAEFSAAQVETIGEYYIAAFDAMVDNPAAAVRDASLMGPAESATVLVKWNDTAADLAPEPILPVLLLRAVKHYPDKVAVRCGDESITYAELHERANRLAGWLGDGGVGPDTVVGIHMRRSIDLVVALVAVLKAGAAYLPLDPDYPPDRLSFMVSDSGAALVLVAEGRPDVSWGAVPVLSLDSADLQRWPAADPPQQPHPENLAYVIFTSGSTGQPKAVQVSHRALINVLMSVSHYLNLTAEDRWLSSTSLSFDIAALELYAPLMVGAEVVLPTDPAGHGPALLAAVESSAATVVQATPSAWRVLLQAGLGVRPHTRGVCGGEAMSDDLARQLAARLGALWNAYGPTETTIWSCLQPMRPGEPVTIGSPISNTEVYVLDLYLRPVPIGVAGELYIGGEGLARGYQNRPGLTAARFVPSRWGTPGSRLYRTGDIVRWQPDGRLAFLGRSDHQVKIRGHRIELGEVESVLCEHPGVEHAVIVAGTDGSGDQTLLAYLTAAAARHPTAAELRRHLSSRLPDYMMPAAFVVLDAFPATRNGKLDRGALPAPSRDDAGAGAFVEPTTETERAIAKLWAAELGIDRVGVEDTFRALGGHSIAALRLVSRINRTFNVEIPLGRLLTGTVKLLAEAVAGGGCQAGRLLVPLREASGRPPCFIVHALGGGLFGYTPLADALPADQPLFGLQSFEVAGIAGPHPATIEAIAEHYLSEVTAVQPRGPYHLSGWCLGGVIAYEMARRLQQQGEQVSTLAILSSSIEDPVPRDYADDQVAVLLAAFGEHLAVSPAELRELPSDKRLALVLSRLHRARIRADIGTVDELDKLIHAYQRHSRAVLTYRDQTRPPYRGDILLIRASSDRYGPGDLGWGPRVQGSVIVVRTPGDHHSMLSKHHADNLARRLATAVGEGVVAAGRINDVEGATAG